MNLLRTGVRVLIYPSDIPRASAPLLRTVPHLPSWAESLKKHKNKGVEALGFKLVCVSLNSGRTRSSFEEEEERAMASTSSGAAGYRGLQLCGSIPTDELSAVNSRWLDDVALLVAMTHQQQIAVAVNRTIVMRLSWAVIGGGGGADQSPPPPMVRKVGSCLEPDEQLTAMEWVVFEAATVLAVGTSFGALLLFSQKGNLLIKQVLESISSSKLLKTKAGWGKEKESPPCNHKIFS